MKKTRLQLLLPALLLTASALAAEPQLGPVIEHYGPVLPPPDGVFNLAPDVHYKASIDVSTAPETPEELNKYIVSAARFLNMHAQQGIPPENIEFAVIVHGKATGNLLTDEAHVKRFGVANPHSGLIKELTEAGVVIYLCSQSALATGIDPGSEVNPQVTISLSAMTAHVRLQQEGYTVIPF